MFKKIVAQPIILTESVPVAASHMPEVIVESPVIAGETPQPNQLPESVTLVALPIPEVIVESPAIAEETTQPTAALLPEITETEKQLAQIVDQFKLTPRFQDRLKHIVDEIVRLKLEHPDKQVDSAEVIKAGKLTRWEFYSLVEITGWEPLKPFGLMEHYDVSKVYDFVEQAVAWLETNKPGEEMSWPLLVKTIEDLKLSTIEWNTLANWSWRIIHYKGTDPVRLAEREKYEPLLKRIEATRVTLEQKMRAMLNCKSIDELTGMTKQELYTAMGMDGEQWSKFCYKQGITFEAEVERAIKQIKQIEQKKEAISPKALDKIRQKMAETSIETLITLTEDQIREMTGYSLQYWNNLKGRGFNFEELRQSFLLNLQELAKARAQKAARLELLRASSLRVTQTSPDELVNRRLSDKLLAEYVTIVSTFFEVRLKDALNIVMEHPSSSLQKAKALVVELKKKCGKYTLHEEYMLNQMANSLAKLELFIEIISIIKDLDGYDEDGEDQDFQDLLNIFNDIKKRVMKLIELAYQEQTDRKINFIDEGTLMVGLLLKTLLTSHIEPAINKEIHRLEDEQGITIGENENELDDNRADSMDLKFNLESSRDEDDADDVETELQEEVGEVEARLSKPPRTYKELYEQLGLLLERIESRITEVQDATGN